MAPRRQPRWLSRAMIDAMHQAQLSEHGGMPGTRDDGMLESALARPRRKFDYTARADMATLAAAYTFGLAKNHGYVDGNKRVAFLAAFVFLSLNGYELDTTEEDVVATIESVASSRMSEASLAKWIRLRTRKRSE